jgi:sigma-B regulation protein RsbU (phosphoserine phosphatase)
MTSSPAVSADLLRQNLPAVVLGSWFVLIGVVSCGLAMLRRRADSRPLVWFGLFIGLYGVRDLAGASLYFHLAAPHGWAAGLVRAIDFCVAIPGIFFWVELSRGWVRRLILSFGIATCSIAALGLTVHLLGVSDTIPLSLNLAVTIGSMMTVCILLLLPGRTRGKLLLQSKIVRIVLPLLVLLALAINLLWLVRFPPPRYLEPIAFMVWIFSLGYEAVSRSFANERRLIAIDTELETARRMQAAILPAYAPDVPGLRIAATYGPMSAVAGDFYHFVKIDERRLGILIADVTGHGVPAALIASMIKVALQSVIPVAGEPEQVMRRLNQILTPELGGSLTSAAYLLVDAKARRARYSAAGHPPLVHWRACCGTVRRIESNGLLFGVLPEAEYPVAEVLLAPGDRLLLYTDGLSEPENRVEEPFGERRLGEVLGSSKNEDAATLSEHILAALRQWTRDSTSQQDDITLIVADVL